MDDPFQIGGKEEDLFGRTEGKGEHFNKLGISELKRFKVKDGKAFH